MSVHGDPRVREAERRDLSMGETFVARFGKKAVRETGGAWMIRHPSKGGSTAGLVAALLVPPFDTDGRRIGRALTWPLPDRLSLIGAAANGERAAA